MTNKDGASKQDLFRKKPAVISAVQYTAAVRDAYLFDKIPLPAGVVISATYLHPGRREVYRADAYIETLEGRMEVSLDDWVITGIKGEKYPCKPDIFVATYEAATPAAPEPANHLGNLLAVIHGDGGHYQDEHGTEKAGEDAIAKWHALTSPPAAPAAGGVLTALQMALSCIRWQHFGECRTEGWPGIPPAPADAAKALEAALSAQAPAPEVAPVRAVEQQPAFYLSSKQLPLLGTDYYFTYRMQAEGNFDTPVYLATPAQATQGGAEPEDFRYLQSKLLNILHSANIWETTGINGADKIRMYVRDLQDEYAAPLQAAAVEPAQAAPAAVVPGAVERKPLTDEQLHMLFDGRHVFTVYEAARLVEKAHGIAIDPLAVPPTVQAVPEAVGRDAQTASIPTALSIHDKRALQHRGVIANAAKSELLARAIALLDAVRKSGFKTPGQEADYDSLKCAIDRLAAKPTGKEQS